MINFCLNANERNTLNALIGKKLLKYRHDPFDKFGKNSVYKRVELFFDDRIILIDYDYEQYRLFDNNVDDHPKFKIQMISESAAISGLQDTIQIDVKHGETISNITLVEDESFVEWDGKTDNVRMLKAIIFEFNGNDIAIQGDYMIPILDVIKGHNVVDNLLSPGDEFNQPGVRFKTKRYFTKLK